METTTVVVISPCGIVYCKCISQGCFPPLQPAMLLDRTNDRVYDTTTNVVRSVMSMTKEAHSVRAEEYVDLVKVSCPFIYLHLELTWVLQARQGEVSLHLELTWVLQARQGEVSLR